SGVNELKLVVNDGGDGVNYDHADWADAKLSCSSDTTPPVTPTGLSAAVTATGITLDWNDNTETDLAGYKVFASSSPGGPFQLLTPQPIKDSTYTDTTVPEGVTVYYQVVAVDTSGNPSPAASASATRPGNGGTAKVEIENLDGGPWQDRLVFSRIGSLASPPPNGVHNLAAVRVKNTGTATMRIGSLPISGPWTLDPAVSLPIDLTPGSSADIRVRFVAEGLTASNDKLHKGTLTINTNDPNMPSLPVQLMGLWQSQSENGQEPTIFQIREAFGYIGSFLGGEANINQKGLVRPQGDEVISAYWQRADETQPVTVRQLAAYHTQGNVATLYWHAKGSNTTSTIFTHAGVDGQTVLPRLNSSLAPIGLRSFTPAAKTFGFKVDSEWSDPAKNSQTADRNNGCARPCGQHIRFFPIKDRAGVLIPNTYYMIMDYNGINYDYNDVNYVISNIKPASMLINVGAAGFTDPAGNVWLPDKDQNGDAIFTPALAINEPKGGYTGPADILGTDNDTLYKSYRGRLDDLSVPQDQRTISFDIPINNGTYQVKLHFAELNWNEAGRRVFDVYAEGALRIGGLDIFQESGGRYTALVKTLDNVQVNDRKLSITLKATTDFPSLSGIEVVR
uniref:malectin domain-containing carbohydrate-binding protein n=1 Tax=Deinococcus apachensis TaxID=309886 RepID=UPI000475EF2C